MTLRAGHPRVLVTAETLPALRDRAKTTHAAELKSLLDFANSPYSPGADGDHHVPVWRLAFLYLVTGERAHADLAIAALRKLLEQPASGQYFTGARRLKSLGLAYDWL